MHTGNKIGNERTGEKGMRRRQGRVEAQKIFGKVVGREGAGNFHEREIPHPPIPLLGLRETGDA